MARPQKEIGKRQFEELCKIQCTLREIAAVLGCSEDTVERWCLRQYEEGFADTYKKLADGGKMSLRRAQFNAAVKGNTTMLVWLGKQYLGQSDKVEQTIREEDLDAVIERELARLAAGG